MVQDQTRVMDVEVHAYFDHLRHPLWFAQGAQRVNDPAGLHGLPLRLHAAGPKGVAQGGGRSP